MLRGRDDRSKEVRRRGIQWTASKVFTVVVLYCISIGLIFLGIKPLLDMFYELKSFANLLFVVSHIFYMFSFITVKKRSHFVFWVASYVLLDALSFMFFFSEDLFL
jgi:hypothetical protein